MSNYKISLKSKKTNFGAKNALFRFFGLEFLKAIVIFEISSLELVEIVFLTYTVNFSIGPALSKGLGSNYSQGQIWGPDFVGFNRLFVVIYL